MPHPIFEEPVMIFLAITVTILVMPLITKKLNIPDIIGLIIGGVIIGQHGIGFLSTGPVITLFGQVGLIYLMFNAGLEINLQQLKNRFTRSIVYAGTSFIIPQLSGILIGQLFGLDLLASILLGAIYASQTLLAYPILSKLGIIKNQAVAITVGATVFTDIVSLVVLAVVTGAQAGGFSFLDISQLIALTIVLGGLILLAVPEMGNRFFKYFNGDIIGFQFILMVVFVAAAVSHLVGIHPIVGAFLAGLAVNRTLSENSKITKDVLFVGKAFFVPLFMVTVGMRLDFIAIFSDLNTLLLGLVLTVAVYGTKLAASWIVSRIYGYSRNEMLTAWGLSQAQAAATLATILVGTRTGIFTDFIFNAAILTIIFTSITSPIIVKKFGEKLTVPAEEELEQPKFNRILLPVFGDESHEHILHLADMLTSFHGGSLLVLNLAKSESKMQETRESLKADFLNKPETKVEINNRITDDYKDAILRVAVEGKATMIFMNWNPSQEKSEKIYPKLIDDILWESDLPVGVAKLEIDPDSIKRLVFVVAARTTGVKLDQESIELVKDTGEAMDLPIQVLSTHHYFKELRERFNTMAEKGRNEISALDEDYIDQISQFVKENDLVIVPSMGSEERFEKSKDKFLEDLLNRINKSVFLVHHP